MTLFIRMPRRQYEISDLYVMALSFCLFFAVARIVKSVVKKQQIQMPNPKGGAIGLQVSNDKELGTLILSCIADDEIYSVKNERVLKAIFDLVQAKIKNESLVLTPNMMRFLALKILNNSNKSSLVTKVGNIVVLSDNRVRLVNRVVGSAVIGFVTGLMTSISYGILLMLLYFDNTANSVYRCDDYFEHLPKDQPVKVFAEKPTGQLVIAGNDDARSVEIYVPSKTSDKVTTSSDEKVTRTYEKSRKKAKVVKFSDFRKTDEVLSAFNDLEEPSVPQNGCPVNDPHDLLNVRID